MPAMSDARAFTTYEASCVLDSRLARKFGRYGPSYRQFLQHSAEKAYDESRKLDVCSAPLCFVLPYSVSARPRMMDPFDPRS